MDSDFRAVSPGTYVRCAMSDVRIARQLKCWSVDLQEAYAVPSAVLERHFPDALKAEITSIRRSRSSKGSSGGKAAFAPEPIFSSESMVHAALLLATGRLTAETSSLARFEQPLRDKFP